MIQKHVNEYKEWKYLLQKNGNLEDKFDIPKKLKKKELEAAKKFYGMVNWIIAFCYLFLYIQTKKNYANLQ